MIHQYLFRSRIRLTTHFNIAYDVPRLSAANASNCVAAPNIQLARRTDNGVTNLVYRVYFDTNQTLMDTSDLASTDNGVLYLYGPTGLAMEFDRYGNSLSLLFDPQGNCVSSANGGQYFAGETFAGSTSYPIFYDGYGSPVWTPPTPGTAPPALNRATSQPFQYKGQYGYYTDGASGLIYCINRFYDPLSGRWTSRDPSGLDGGVNVYAYVGGDPIGLVDPDGTRPMRPLDYVRIRRLYAYAKAHGADPDLIKAIDLSVQLLEFAIDSADVHTDPLNLQAAWWAIDHLGDKSFGDKSPLEVPGISDIPGGKIFNKCNTFACMAYSVGAGLGWDGKGVPTRSQLLGFRGHPYLANEMATSSVLMKNFPIVESLDIGDIMAFYKSKDEGHATISLGGSLLIYASTNDVKIQTIDYVRATHKEGSVIRRYRKQ